MEINFTDPIWIEQYGLPLLFVICFAAATVFPFSSEIAFATAIGLGWPAWSVLMVASVGNVLGASTNYFLGYFFSLKMRTKLQEDRWGNKVIQWSQKYGRHLIWLNPLPLIGDPVTILSGIARDSWQRFIPIVFGLRIARYYLLLLSIQ